MKNIEKKLEALREVIIDDCAISEDMLELEQQWIDRIDEIIKECAVTEIEPCVHVSWSARQENGEWTGLCKYCGEEY